MRTRVLLKSLLIAGYASVGACSDGVSPDQPNPEPSTRLLSVSDLRYEGAFRLPSGTFGISSLNYAEGPIDVMGSSLLIVGHAHHQAIAEFAIPALVRSESLDELNMAGTPVQPFVGVFDRVAGNPQGLDRIAALRRMDSPNGRVLVVNSYEYYDAPADNTHTTLVVRDPTMIGASAVDGFFSLQGAAHAGGWVSDVPVAWRDALGGEVLVGSSSGVPIIGRLSVGPTAFVLDRAHLTAPVDAPDPIPTTALLDYSLAAPLNSDLSNESQTNSVWTHLSRAVFGFIAPDTRTYVVLGHSGGHGPDGICYKCVPKGMTASCGGYCPVDPADRSLFYWFYDVEDLVKVRSGDLAPHDVRPYESGELPLPFSEGEMGGGSYDLETGLLYLSLLKADRAQGTYANPPVIVALRIAS